ncbi:hypothetical protein HZA71_00045 [Candidatus Falkowbacteria bacterium]|nr:hypothetical protein [Candidatus Falkowbacteria bacterium]
MNRIIFKKGKQKTFLIDVKSIGKYSNKKIGKLCGVHGRTISGWLSEKTSMPLGSAKKLAKIFLVKLPNDCEIKPAFWYTKQAGHIGGMKRFKKYGYLGNKESRRLGGIRAQITHRKLGTKFKQRKKIIIPRRSEKLSEFIGILLGDGGIGKYQISISLNSSTDFEYSNFIVKLINELFKIELYKTVREKNCLQIIASSISLVEFLTKEGLPQGNKVRYQVDVPSWIKKGRYYRKACLRGLIDTDGCVYIDNHISVKGKKYSNICLDFTNRSFPLLDFIYESLLKLSFQPQRYKYSIKLRREADIWKYYKQVGSSNQKHFKKFNDFFKNKFNKERSHSG